MDKLTKELATFRQKNKKAEVDYVDRKKALEAQKEAAVKRAFSLREMRKGSVSSTYVITDTQGIDMGRVAQLIS